ncbi:MAG: hypothetical protein QOE14_2281, partial [Humisphaera sp.]|nr:hypothetical protein [Humisphaera sp.]
GLPPAPAGNPALGAVVTVYCPGLGDAGVRTVMNREIQLVKRRNWDATPSVGVYDVPAGAGGVDYNDNSLVNPNWLLDMVPVDAFDFTGLPAPLITPGPREEWHYRRQTSGGPWRFVYPGRYDGSLSTPGRPRQAGVQSAEWDTFVTPGSLSPWTGVPPATLAMSLGQSYIGAAYVPATCDNPDASYPRPFTIQWANGNFDAAAGDPGAFVGINRTGAGVNLFPFGGFMRNGDVLSVPFIGAYCIRPVPAPPAPIAVPPSPGPLWFFEMNPVTMDAAMAEDGEWMNDPDLAPAVPTGAYDEYREQLGRFFPPSNPTAMPASAYEWASDILDQFTVQNPHDDFLANVDPTRYPVPGGGVRTPGVASDGGAAANTENDQEIPIEGLINVNTASAKVLSQLPLVVDPATGSVNVNQTERLAQSIVYFRDVDQGNGQPYGPFKNLFELNRVTDVAAPAQGFRNMLGNMVDNGDSDDNQGDYSPLGAALDGVAMDYEERYGNLMRLSNLMTTRSDVFTVYVLVQGWKNVGSPYPVLVAERRSAFIADRTRINSVNSAVDTVPVPTR